MNKGQIMSAIGNLKEALRLMHLAESQLNESGIELCSINPSWLNKGDEIHVYRGIERMAEAAGGSLAVDETTTNKDLWFSNNGIRFFEIIQNDGSYREAKA